MSLVYSWIIKNYQWLTEVSVGAFVAYHLYYLSKRVTGREKLEHKERIKVKADELCLKIAKEGLRSKVYLVNINRYFTDYPSNSEKIKGYSIFSSEIKTTRYDGVEFFSSLPKGVYKRPDGQLTFKDLGEGKKVYTVIPVGVVPYDWIDFVDLEGDEFGYTPIFFVHFKGKVLWSWWRKFIPFGSPYIKIVYYRRSETYRKGIDPRDMEWIPFYESVQNG